MNEQAIIALSVGIWGIFTTLIYFMIKSFQSSIRREMEDMSQSLKKISESFFALDKNVAVMSKIIDIMSDEIDRFRCHMQEGDDK